MDSRQIQTVLVPLGTMEAHGVTANGADILAPVAIAKQIAPKLNAMIAPVIPFGVTGGLDAYPGSFTIPEDAYRPYVRAALLGLAKGKFKNLILINGHGGGQTAILSAHRAGSGTRGGRARARHQLVVVHDGHRDRGARQRRRSRRRQRDRVHAGDRSRAGPQGPLHRTGDDDRESRGRHVERVSESVDDRPLQSGAGLSRCSTRPRRRPTSRA